MAHESESFIARGKMTIMNGLSVSLRGLLLVALLLVGNFASAFAATVKDIRLGVTKERTRIVLDLQSNVDFDIFLLDSPRRVVVDLPSLEWPENQPKEAGLVQKLRFGQ
ncbi:MAG: AMIN domain-containing protein, partial [Parvibaculales bacterium]